MIYTVAFISNQQLRDIKLEGILNPEFVIDKYVHEGLFDYSLRINQRGYFEVYSYKQYNNRSILNCTKWKTTRGAEAGIAKIKAALSSGDKRKISVRGDDLWKKNEYIPVICNLTDEWNKKIQGQIDKEVKEHQKRVDTLIKKLAKN
jgi:hypothetical protein